MNQLAMVLIAGLVVSLCSTAALAAPDQYPGDTSIYGSQVVLAPNVLLVIDTSGSMIDPQQDVQGGSFTRTTNYTQSVNCGTTWLDSCLQNSVYVAIPATSDGMAPQYTLLNASINNIATSCSYTTRDWRGTTTHTSSPKSTLTSTGMYSGQQLNADGSCGTGQTGYQYMLGNYVNYLFTPGSTMHKMDVVKNVVDQLIKSTTGVRFGVMTYNYDASDNGSGGTFLAGVPAGGSATYTSTIQDMDSNYQTSPGVMTNRTALRRLVRGIYANENGNTPLAETLYEAGQYYGGAAPAFGASVGVVGGTYVSPAVPSCRKNYVVFLTDGMSTADKYQSRSATIGADPGPLGSFCRDNGPSHYGDCDGDGNEPGFNSYNKSYDYSDSMDDVAKFLNLGAQNVVTYTIGFGAGLADSDADGLLTRTANSTHGKGAKYLAQSQTDLSNAFTSIFSSIFAVNSSYVAPVVPVSPENRTYGGKRVYMGFFKPQDCSAWLGNLKKYGIDANSNIVDMTGAIANYVDINRDGRDDNTGATLVSGAINGSFISTAKSYWSSASDGAEVSAGGAGEKVRSLAPGSVTTTRKLKTLTSTAAGSSMVDLSSSSITPAMLGFTSTDSASKTALVNFTYGLDITSVMRPWVLGDVMHSRPLIVNYAQYTFCDSSKGDDCTKTLPTANETSCTVNKTTIFVGGNDGMLHAYNDCDGTEAWAFIPPDLLPNLQYVNGDVHTNFVDSTPSVYLYNKLNDGNISSTTDKVILMVGERRGGGSTSAATGSYYLLDVTDRTTPKFLYAISNSTTGFGELAETWSEPKIVKMKIGTVDSIVAFFGGGYDNQNEDMRYGNTQAFSGVTPVNLADIGQSPSVSASGSATSPDGRGVFAVQLATLDASGVPAVLTTPTKLWSYTYGATVTTSATGKTDPNLNFSIPSEITAIDSKGGGYTDTFYVGDTGGNIWRFNVGDSNTANWTGTKIFRSNPASGTDLGRKLFFKPSVVSEPGYKMLFFATGDREHPLNTAVTDRMYALKDPVAPGTPIATTLSESDLMDVTADSLQTTTITGDASVTGSVANLLSSLYTKSGWFIKLNQDSGEKCLATPMVFNKVAYFTTYAPGITNTDPCATGNLGTSRGYALNYKTGEAVLDYDTSNDTTSTTNVRAVSSSGSILLASDRVKITGTGIPSGLVVVLAPNGKLKALTGVGGAIAPDNPAPGGSIVPLYWRQK
jgi:type IV pilus assembly protein PilY1